MSNPRDLRSLGLPIFLASDISPDAHIYGFGVTFDDLQNIGGDFGIFNFLENCSHLKVKFWPFS